MLRKPEVPLHGQGDVLGEYRRAGIALFVRIMPVLIVAGQLQLNLPLLKLGFLDAEKVRILLGKKCLKALFPACPQAVYVP